MHITHTDFTHRQWDYYERHCVQCTIRWHSQVSVIKFCCGNTGSFNSGSAHFAPFQNSISRSCFPPWVFVLHDKTYTASSCLTQLYVEFFAHFWAKSWLLQDRLKVRPIFAQFPRSSWAVLGTFSGTSSENSQILQASCVCWQTCCVQIGASSVKSGGSYKGSNMASFHTFLHRKMTVFEPSEIEAVLLHSS